MTRETGRKRQCKAGQTGAIVLLYNWQWNKDRIQMWLFWKCSRVCFCMQRKFWSTLVWSRLFLPAFEQQQFQDKQIHRCIVSGKMVCVMFLDGDVHTVCVSVCASSPVALNHPLLCLTAPSCSSQASGGKVGVKVKSAYQKRFGFHFVRLHVDRCIFTLWPYGAAELPQLRWESNNSFVFSALSFYLLGGRILILSAAS